MTILNNTATQTVAPGETINLGNVVLQKGCFTRATNNGIGIYKSGIYEIISTVVGLVTGGGILEYTVLNNGTPIGYLTAQAYTNTGEPSTVTLAGHITVNPNCCAINTNVPANITLQNTSTTTSAVISNVTLDVTKVR